jgi:hypothetical protein
MTEKAFDGAAISRADSEFLASLDAHPLQRHALYGTPCPLPANLGPYNPTQDAARQANFAAIVDWMAVNFAFCKSAFIGKGGIISLVSGELTTVMALRGFMKPHALISEGPRGGINIDSAVDTWMGHARRLHIDMVQTRTDRLRPTFFENDLHIYNRYRSPAHPADGGDLTVFNAYFARLIPDAEERAWVWWWLCHKARRPWIPMVAIIMVAEEFGSGRGTLFDILEGVFGADYVIPCTFGELTGASPSARFNARLADALLAVINEAVDEDGHQQSRRRLTYEALKNAIEPSPTARKRFEAKGQHAFAQRAAMSAIIATQHADVIKLPWDDRRFSVITCGVKMTAEERAEIRAWMADPANLGALYRALLATPAAPIESFDPFGVPPPFAGRLEMIGLGKSEIEDAYEAAMTALESCALFTRTQAVRLISYFAGDQSGGSQDRAKHTITKKARRLRDRGEPYDRFWYRNRQDILYARTETERRRWRGADREMVIAALERTEAQVTKVVSAGAGDALKAASKLAPGGGGSESC